jgi:hypothetical protein
MEEYQLVCRICGKPATLEREAGGYWLTGCGPWHMHPQNKRTDAYRALRDAKLTHVQALDYLVKQAGGTRLLTHKLKEPNDGYRLPVPDAEFGAWRIRNYYLVGSVTDGYGKETRRVNSINQVAELHRQFRHWVGYA